MLCIELLSNNLLLIDYDKNIEIKNDFLEMATKAQGEVYQYKLLKEVYIFIKDANPLRIIYFTN